MRAQEVIVVYYSLTISKMLFDILSRNQIRGDIRLL